MFIPKIYRSEDKKLMKKIISENAFAMLLSYKEKLFATHSVFIIKETITEDFYLETHLSKANLQAKNFENGDEVLCDFLGAHTYISSSWYNHTNVSTWNYEAVQIRGTIEIMQYDELYAHLEQLTNKYEESQKCPMTVAKMGKEFVEKEMQGALGLKIFPTEIHIAEKLSQNRKEEDFQKIIEELENSPKENAKKIAKSMRKLKNNKPPH